MSDIILYVRIWNKNCLFNESDKNERTQIIYLFITDVILRNQNNSLTIIHV